MTAAPETWTEVADHAALTALLGEPSAAVRGKERTSLTDLDRDWLAAASVLAQRLERPDTPLAALDAYYGERYKEALYEQR